MSELVHRSIAAELPACKRQGCLEQVSPGCCSLPESIQMLQPSGLLGTYFCALIPGERQRALGECGRGGAGTDTSRLHILPGHCSTACPCVCPALPTAWPAGTDARAPQSPTSTPRRRPAPHAVLPVLRGAEDGGLSGQRVAGVAGVDDYVRVGEGVHQVPTVSPVGDVWWRIADDTCGRVQGGF